MRQSRLFTKVQRTAPKDETAVNAVLLERGGFIYKNSAGIYSYLPLGWRVIQKIMRIIREEMDAIGGEEMFMPALHDKHYLQATGRWDVGVVFKVSEGVGKEPNFNLSWTHEEIITEIASKYISSYKDLPFAVYQIQTKFRNEPRAKSGILRGREFMMKDLYSFHESEKDLLEYYAKVAEAYRKVFRRCGLEPVYTLASGGDFTSGYTHEFQVISEVGEDTILVCEKCGYAENKDISKLADGGKCGKCGGSVAAKKAIEVGNIFPLGTRYSEALNLKFKDKSGKEKLVVMGSYGIGVSRLMAAIVEVYNDKNGIIWPVSVAPFKAHLLALNGADGNKIYEFLVKQGIDALYDDRDLSAGEKFAEADLLGVPWRLIASPKLGEMLEVKKRGEANSKTLSPEEALRLMVS